MINLDNYRVEADLEPGTATLTYHRGVLHASSRGGKNLCGTKAIYGVQLLDENGEPIGPPASRYTDLVAIAGVYQEPLVLLGAREELSTCFRCRREAWALKYSTATP